MKASEWKKQWIGCYTCSVAINSTKAISKMGTLEVVVGGNSRDWGGKDMGTEKLLVKMQFHCCTSAGIHAKFDIGNDNLFDCYGPVPLEWSVLSDSTSNA